MKDIIPYSEVIREIPLEVSERFGGIHLPVFMAYGCVLLEIYTGKSYSYKAVNLESGASANICRRSKKLDESDYEDIAAKIREKDIAGSGRMQVAAKPGRKCDYEKLSEIMTYIFNKLLPEHGYNIREPQIELANHMLDTLNRRGISLSEAEVGTGKTHAYLIAAILIKRGRVNDFWLNCKYPGLNYASSMPVIISTSNIALQKAIVLDYIPEISRILMDGGVIPNPVSSVIRKGKEHYICEKRLRSYLENTGDLRTNQVLTALLDKNYRADIDELDNISPHIKRKISVSGNCGKDCRYRDTCKYLRYLQHAQSDKHDFQVCNHNYLLADVIRRSKGQQPLIPHYQAIIIDEAHKFLQAARQMYGVELSSLILPRISVDICGLTFQHRQSTAHIQKNTEKLAGQSGELFRLLNRGVRTEDYDDETERFKTMIGKRAGCSLRNIRQILDNITETLSVKQVIRKYEGVCANILQMIADVRDRIVRFEKYGDLVYWLEYPGRKPEDETMLCAIPKKLNSLLYSSLWNKGIPIILTSGTLAADGSFVHIKKNMGLDKARSVMETVKSSPFNHRENVLLYISENTPFPDNKDERYIEAVADEVERLIIAAHGHAAVLFTSYRVMESVFGSLERRDIRFPLFRLDKGGTNVINQFKKSGNGVLFASGSLWEGIDLPGDILSLLIIVKLPFAVPDSVSEYEQGLYDSMNEYKNNVVVPDMIVKLKQGFGRLIRTETDTGVVAFLDSRVNRNEAYRSRVLKALPDCHITSDIKDVMSFIRDKKAPEYFK